MILKKVSNVIRLAKIFFIKFGTANGSAWSRMPEGETRLRGLMVVIGEPSLML